MHRPSVAVILMAGVFLSGLLAAPAAAVPGDPAPGWPTRQAYAHRDVDISGSGQAFTLELPRAGTRDRAILEHGVGEAWPRVAALPRAHGGVVVGLGDDAVAVTGNVSRVFDGTSWADPVTITDEIAQSRLVGNADGHAALLWSASDGEPFLSRLSPGGTWRTSRVPSLPADVASDLVLTDTGKLTVVWAVPQGETSEIYRSVLHAGSTTWSAAASLGTVSTTRPGLTLVADGQGRETLLAGNKLWRQVTPNTTPAYQFRTSSRAQLSTGDTATRVVWPVKADGRYELRTRYVEQEWSTEAVLWTRAVPADAACDLGIELGTGMAPAGRSYVAVGIRHQVGACDGVEIAEVLTVDRWDGVLNRMPVGHYMTGGSFQVDVGARGPVAVEYEYERTSVNGADGLWYLRFFSR